MNNGYSICFNDWAVDKRIKNELGLLLIISGLCAQKGYCYASNENLSERFDIDTSSMSKKIKKLERFGYISIEYKTSGNVVISREIRILPVVKNDNSRSQKCQPPLSKMTTAVVKNAKDNNTSINTTSNNITSNTPKTFKCFNEEDLEKQILSVRSEFKELTADDLEDFLNYWISDTDVKGNIKPRIQHQNSWNIRLRLRTWSRNKSNFKK